VNADKTFWTEASQLTVLTQWRTFVPWKPSVSLLLKIYMKVRYCPQKNMPLEFIQNYLNPINAFTPYSFQIHFYLILQSTPKFPSCLPLSCSQANILWHLHLSYTFHRIRSSYPSFYCIWASCCIDVLKIVHNFYSIYNKIKIAIIWYMFRPHLATFR
jgi:hypothetical protein